MLNQVQFTSYNNSNYKNKNSSTKIKAAAGALAGTVIPVALMMKNQKVKNPFKLNYALKDMLILSGTSVVGGTLAGMVGETRQAKENKFKEGTFQFLNASIPAVMVGGAMKCCEKFEKLNKVSYKIAAVFVGIAAGMLIAVKLANKIFDPKDIYPDRKLSSKDCLASADDAIGALALAKFPLISKLHLDKLLPLIYAYCGYRAGKTA